MEESSHKASRLKPWKRIFKVRTSDEAKSLSASTENDANSTKSTIASTTSLRQGSSPTPSSAPVITADDDAKLNDTRNALWKKAYEKLEEQDMELAQVYEALLKNDAGVDQNADMFTQDVTTTVVQTQLERMESKQWTYSWFGKSRKVRDTAESILMTIEKVSGPVLAGMSAAPPFVSIPFSMATSLTAFIMADFEATTSAIDGLREVIGVLANYSYAEQEFLSDQLTRKDFEDIVLDLYVAIFEYQARVAQYFARNTLKRLGYNTLVAQPWPQAAEKVRNLDRACLSSLTALGVRLNQRRFSNVEDLLNQGLKMMDHINHTIKANQNQIEMIREWISLVNYSQDHVEIQNQIGGMYLGSGRWLLQDNTEFRSWVKSQRGILFLQGVVGAGKTSLTSMVIQHLLGKGQVAFFYCSANAAPREPLRTSHNDTCNIFQSVLAQCAVRADGTISEIAQSSFNKTDRRAPGGCDMTLNAVISTLKDVLQERKDERVTLVFDALDECKDHDEFLSCLADLMKSIPKIRVFVSTRYGIDITSYFDSYRALSIGSQNSDDINAYVESEISKRGSRMSAQQAQRLKQALVKYSDGVFRWVVLELDLFFPRSQRQGARMMSKDIDRRLDKLERSQAPAVERLFSAYEEIYHHALGGEDELSRHFVVKTAMKWVLCSFGQLTTNHLLQAVSILPDGTKDYELTIEDILEYCSNFLIRVAEDFIKLTHLSVRQFFEEKKSTEFSPPQQHLQASLTCLHLVRASFLEGELEPYKFNTRRPALKDFPLLRCKLIDGGKCANTFNNYAYFQWSMHCRAAAESEELTKLLLSPEVRDVFIPKRKPLHLIIARKVDLTSKDNLGNTLLHYVVVRNDLPGLELLLRTETLQGHSGLTGLRNEAGNTPLHIAAAFGYYEAFHDLVVAGSKLDATNVHNLTPAHIAVIQGRDQIVQLIGQFGAKVVDKSRNSLLHYASFFDRSDAVRALIKYGWPKNAPNDLGDTALHLTARTGSLQSYKTLLAANVSTEIRNLDSQTANDLFDRSRFSEDDIADIKPQRPTRVNTALRNRCHIQIDDPEVTACKYCDLEGWLNGSREGLSSVYIASLEQRTQMYYLIRDKKLTCKLCIFLQNFINSLPNARFHHIDEVKIRARLDIDSGGLETGKDVLSISASGVEYDIEICLDAAVESSSPLGSMLQGRMFNSKGTNSYIIGQLNDWITDCRSHESCEDDHNVFPKRLVDLGESQGKLVPRLIETNELFSPDDRRYVFLSGHWGTAPFFRTQLSNLKEFKNGMALSSFAPTDQEAMQICRDLGYRYLWVDSLCIIQGCRDDFMPETRRQGLYVTAADLVLVATTSKSEPLIPDRKPGMSVSISARLANDEKKTWDSFLLYLRQPLKNATTALQEDVLSHAWMIQDVLLARRIVIFDSSQLFWSCCETLKSEGSTHFLPPRFEPIPALAGRLARNYHIQSDLEATIFRYWYSIVEICTSGKLTRQENRLLAVDLIVVILRIILEAYSTTNIPNVQRSTTSPTVSLDKSKSQDFEPFSPSYRPLPDHGGIDYASGIWTKDLLRGLLWISSRSYPNFQKLEQCPSWSWARNEVPVSYCLEPGLNLTGPANARMDILNVLESEIAVWAMSRDLSEDFDDACKYEFFWDSVLEPKMVDNDDYDDGSQMPIGGDSQPYENGNKSYSLDGHAWTPGTILILVTPWTFRPSFGLHDARWAGLVLKPELPNMDKEKHSRYIRRGVFLGPLCNDEKLDGWKRKGLVLC